MSSKFQDFEYPPADQVWRRVQIEVEGDARPGALSGHMGEFVHVPRAEVWSRIAAEVGPRRRREAIFWWVATAASVLLLLFVGWRFSSSKQGEVAKPAASWSAVVPTDSMEDSFSGSGQGQDASEGRNRMANDPRGPGKRSLQEQGLSPLLFASVDHGSDTDYQEDLQMENDQWSIPRHFLLAADTLQDSKQSPKYRFAIKKRPENNNWDDLPPLPDRDRKIYAAAFGSSYGAAGSFLRTRSEQEPGYFLGLGQEPIVQDLSFGPVNREEFGTPFIFGLQLRKTVGRRLSIGAGPVYTLMTSTSQETQSGAETFDRIRRQYLGAAISANYEFLQGKRIATYVTAGTRLDFGLDHRKRSLTYKEGQLTADVVQNYKLGPQALANAGLGVNYNLTEQLGLYLEGSIMHAYFRTDPNLWTVRRYWPGLQVGLRLHL